MNTAIFKSIGAVLAGIAINVVLTLATDLSFSAAGVFPAFGTGFYVTWMVTLALAYRTLYAGVGGYLVARLAPRAPMKHVIWLMTIGGVVGTLSVFGGWHMFPHWYLIAIVIGSVLATWIGGRLVAKRSS